MNPALWLLAPLAFLVLVGPGRRHNAITLVAAATVEVIVATVIAIGGVDTGADDLLTTDATARLFLLVIDWAFVGVVVYAWNRARVDATRPEASARRAYLGIVFLVAMNVVVIANHMLLAWLALEVTSLAAAPQIAQASLPGSRGASWRYLVFSIVGLGLASLGFWCLGHGGDGHASMRFDVLAHTAAAPDDPWRELGFALLVLGLGTKLGLAPMCTRGCPRPTTRRRRRSPRSWPPCSSTARWCSWSACCRSPAPGTASPATRSWCWGWRRWRCRPAASSPPATSSGWSRTRRSTTPA
jgi:hydrogenase-4 component F